MTARGRTVEDSKVEYSKGGTVEDKLEDSNGQMQTGDRSPVSVAPFLSHIFLASIHPTLSLDTR